MGPPYAPGTRIPSWSHTCGAVASWPESREAWSAQRSSAPRSRHAPSRTSLATLRRSVRAEPLHEPPEDRSNRMTAGPSIAAFVVGAAVSLLTSWVLVSRLERVGERLGLSEALLGLVAALAADAPEITASVTALAHHQRAVGAGVTIGSNVFNLAALLGLGAVVAGRIGLHRKVVVLGGTLALVIAAFCLLAVAGVVAAGTGLALALVVLV